MSSVPNRWTDYKPMGERVEGTRFVAFKVPLRPDINRSVDEEHRLDIPGLLRSKPDLGLIIDLTNTNRYYDPKSFESAGVQYKKLKVPGHATPRKNLVRTFKKYVINFLRANQENDKLIGVHCTHGVNRTGYLICNYMVSELAIAPDMAMRLFDEARGHKIERANYVNALYELHRTPSASEQFKPPIVQQTNWRERPESHAHSDNNYQPVDRNYGQATLPAHTPPNSWPYSWRSHHDESRNYATSQFSDGRASSYNHCESLPPSHFYNRNN